MRPWPCRRKSRYNFPFATQQILAHESGIADVVDPLGGSYFVEDLTHRLEKGVGLHQKNRRHGRRGGGSEAVIKWGKIHQAAYRHQIDVEEGRRTIVGVNRYVAEDAPVQGC